MKVISLSLKFDGQRRLSSLKKKALLIGGGILILTGFLGMVHAKMDSNLFYLVLTAGGMLNVAYGLFGRKLIKERNCIFIDSEDIEYKNSFRKSRKIKIADLLDLRIEASKVEFVMLDQKVLSYDFSVFQTEELEKINKELEKLKVNLIRQHEDKIPVSSPD